MITQEIIEWLEWIVGDDDCLDKDKLPLWAKDNINDMISELKGEEC